MKLYTTVFFFSLILSATSQDIEIYEFNTAVDISGTCINAIHTDSVYNTYYQYFTFKNTTNSPKNINFKRVKLIGSDAQESISWGPDLFSGVDYPSDWIVPYNPWTSPDYFLIDSSSTGELYLYYENINNSYGKYRYYMQEYFPSADSSVVLDSIDVEFGSTLSIAAELPINISVFPNPVIQILNINIENLGSNFSIFIHDITGKKVLEAMISNGKNQIDVSSLYSGVYFYTIGNQKGPIETKKILIQ